MIISGNKIARAIRDELKGDVQEGLSLHIFVVGDDPVIENFVMKKKQFAESIGVAFIEHRMADTVDNPACQECLHNDIQTTIDGIRRNNENKIGMVVQLPLPASFNTQEVLDAVPSQYDVDGLATNSIYIEPVAGAVKEIVTRKSISIKGQKALVIGKGRLVGEPVAKLLKEMEAKVTVVDDTTSLEALTIAAQSSDIIVSGAGVPELIIPSMVKPGATLLDAGTSTQGGSVVGDISYECKDVARYFSRTPGGIGPVTVAVLFQNLVRGGI